MYMIEVGFEIMSAAHPYQKSRPFFHMFAYMYLDTPVYEKLPFQKKSIWNVYKKHVLFHISVD